MVVSTAITVAVLVVVFVGVFPKVADYSEAWSAIQQMPTAYLVALVVATVVNLAVYVWPLQAALPGLGYGPGFVVRQTSFAISNAVPAGGAVGLGVQYGMLDSYGFGAGAAASAIAIVSVFNVFATLVMPVLGVLALLASGVVERTYVLLAVVGIVVIGVAVVAFAVVLRSEHGARTIGRWADRLIDPLIRRLRHGQSADLTGKLLDFRSSVVDVMRTRWLQVTVSTLFQPPRRQCSGDVAAGDVLSDFLVQLRIAKFSSSNRCCGLCTTPRLAWSNGEMFAACLPAFTQGCDATWTVGESRPVVHHRPQDSSTALDLRD